MNAPLATPSQTATAKKEDAATTRALPTPGELRHAQPVSPGLARRIDAQRQAIRDILAGRDDRLLVVVGPCSIHDPGEALDYARRLAELADKVSDRLLLVMRVYVEKPRTTVGWKGLAYDPALDGSGDMAQGLAISRRVMREVAELGLPVATELLQPMLAPYLDDLLAWVAIGARTTESQLHRELASGLAAAVGFKNATSGDIGVALDAMRAAAHPHQHFAVALDGQPEVRETAGNAHTHLVLRGGHGEPNYQASHVAAARRGLENAGLLPRIMVDCSHANARKDHRRQSEVLLDVVAQRLAGERALCGLMLESHLHEGKQPLNPGKLRHGVSVTDACIGWETTEHLLLDTARRLRLS
ncbi:3-deoxy-7-phosphoheptulonate synthase [Halomonas urumqiensis]|uniref:Phospho-2-dehydro-3-deoxyheptonate aldolase n=1 Tax=Halomonas urumqiensis TaxID=1684789 RepID=A0A2N7UIP6_9GAMM|nr:3-deoxy-7-phosphoheptulonate synthase [Halomonas urumqiensis]PMR80308.1 3-deoxy-7-phosphoheptulonate synthase [Halomonas urumqiensis]PTB01588.1 3-deoxy-7-phosphoheptulonate synthase [Halomonas urumqiensis]GHE22322.1 phospho-2-dehydro-3-deoxyheptonate aldolase [Halomonas urumqiensis]